MKKVKEPGGKGIVLLLISTVIALFIALCLTYFSTAWEMGTLGKLSIVVGGGVLSIPISYALIVGFVAGTLAQVAVRLQQE
ncbi:MAG: hypothetical protein WD552_02525 [Candidatus Paceibacterota bacterium]